MEALLKYWPIVVSIFTVGGVSLHYLIKGSRILERIEQTLTHHGKDITDLTGEVSALDAASRKHSTAIAVLQAR